MGELKPYAKVEKDPDLKRAMLDFEKGLKLEQDGNEGFGFEPRSASSASQGPSDSARDKISDGPIEE
jgi:hypothetical protein